jgi:hypothetical protein
MVRVTKQFLRWSSYFSLSFGFEGGGPPTQLGKLQFFPAKYQTGKTLKISGADLAALCGQHGSGCGIVIDNKGAPGAYSNVCGMRLGFSLRNIATARANVAAVDTLTHDEVKAAAWREWNGAMGRIAILDDPSTPAMQRELGLFYSTLYHSNYANLSTLYIQALHILMCIDKLFLIAVQCHLYWLTGKLLRTGMKKPTDWTGQVPPTWVSCHGKTVCLGTAHKM